MSTEAEDARDYNPVKPNHFVHDGLGDPETCKGDHNHPPRATTGTPWPPPSTAIGPYGSTLGMAASTVEVFKGTELSFSFPHTGGVFTRLSRSEPSDFDGLELIDLRVLRAHLEEASFLVANAIMRHEQQR